MAGSSTLTRSQVARMFAILDPLTTYANDRLGIVAAEELAGAPGPGLDPNAQALVLNELWEERHVIDDFLAANPSGLSAGQLAIARTWRDALYGVFTISRFPDGKLRFVGFNRAFEVCGISYPIEDMISDVPTVVFTALLPFEGRIVYAEAMREIPISIGDGMRKMLDSDAGRMLADGAVVSTAEELLRVIPIIREERIRRESEQLAEELEHSLEPEPESGQGWHRGVLAGMPHEQREAAIREHMDRTRERGSSADLAELLEKRCRKGEARTDLAGLLGLDVKDRLLAVARAFGLPVKSNWKKDDLIEALQAFLVLPEGMTRIVHSLHMHEIEGLKRLVDAGGQLAVSASSLDTLNGLPQSITGLSYAFRSGDVFTFVVPDEIMPILRDFDWDSAFAEANEHQEVAKIADALVELRGVVDLADFLAEYMRLRPHGFDGQDAYDSLMEAMDTEAVSCSLLDAGDRVFLLYYQVAAQWRYEHGDDHPYSRDPFLEGKVGMFLGDMLASQRGKDPRPLEQSMLDEPSIFHWKEKRAPVAALRDFLDAHVPDDADDYFFADKVIEDILEEAKWGDVSGFQAYADIMEANGILLDERDLQSFLNLLTNVVNGLPNWANNGWAPNELVERETGCKAFFNEDGSPMKVGRNDPCPCGSGKKYKQCCGRPSSLR